MKIEELEDFLNSEEGKRITEEFFDKIRKEEEVRNKQMERFHRVGNFPEFTEKVIKKYESNEYKDRWYRRGIIPPEDLLFFLFYYAEKYGRECDEQEWEKHGNDFTTSLFFCNDYYFNRMDGQGSVILVTK